MADATSPRELRGPYAGCWEWTGPRFPKGYGHISGPVQLVHRAVYAAVYGEIPDGLCVLHRCDNPPCFRPDHLWLGTVEDNVADMDAKGRRTVLRGEANPVAKLTWAAVAEIRERYPMESQQALADAFGVSKPTIQRIVTGLSWKVVA